MNDADPLQQITLQKLEYQRRLQGWLKFGVSAAAVLAGIAAALFLWLQEDAPYWLGGLAALLVWVFHRAGQSLVVRLVSRHRRALDLVRTRRPLSIALRPTRVLAFEGRLFGDREGKRVLAFQIPKYSKFGWGGETTPIMVWECTGSDEIVGNDGGEVVIGKRLDRVALDASLRRVNAMWYGVATFSLVLVLIPMGFVQWMDKADLQHDLALAVASHAWPTTAARVVTTSLREIRISRGRSTVSAWLPDIQYEYQAAGRKHSGKVRRFYEEPFDTRQAAQAVLDGYPPGREIPVAVSPDNPALAVIEPGHEQPLNDKIRNIQYLTLALTLTGVLVCALLAGLAGWQRRLGRQLREEIFG